MVLGDLGQRVEVKYCYLDILGREAGIICRLAEH